MSIVLTPFARTRLFPRQPRGNTIRDCTPEAFEQYLNANAPLQVLEGYAPFCKLYVYRNWTSTRCLTVPITADNRHLLRSAYEARSREELPVLVRWFEGVEPPVADYLVVILYSRDQLAREGSPIEADWGVAANVWSCPTPGGPAGCRGCSPAAGWPTPTSTTTPGCRMGQAIPSARSPPCKRPGWTWPP